MTKELAEALAIQALTYLAGDGERLGHLTEAPARDPVHDAGQQAGLLRRNGRNTGLLCHTR